MPTRKLVVSTYLQYILIAVGVFLLVLFVRQLSGVLGVAVMAAILAYEHWEVRGGAAGLDLPRIDRAFFHANVAVSTSFFAFTLLARLLG